MSLTRSLLLACTLAMVPAIATAAPPIAAYGQLPGLGDFAISPDGTRYAAIVGSASGSEIQVRELATGNLIVATPAGAYKLRAVQWAGNDNVVLTLSQTTGIQSTDYQFVGEGEHSQLLSYNLSRKAWLRLLNNIPLTANVVAGPPVVVEAEGKPMLIATGFSIPSTTSLSTVFRIDPANGRTVVIERGAPNTYDWVVDGAGTLVARADYDQASGQWKVLTPRGAGWGEVYKEIARVDSPDLVGLGRTPGTVLINTHRSGTWQMHELNLADGTLSAPKPEYSGDAVLHDKRSRTPIGTINTGMMNQDYDFWNVDDQKLWRSVGKAFPGALVTLTDWTPDRQTVAVTVFGPAQGDAIYVIDRKARTAGMLTQRYPQVTPADMGAVQAITYKAADGTEIPAYLTLPPGREAKNLPLIALPHGGPAVRDEPGFDWWAQALASRGYAVLQPQFRGSDGFGTAFRDKGFGEWGRKMQTDVSDGVRHLAAQGIIDPKRVCIAGASYGGYAAMAGVTVEQGVYRCASAVAGVSDPGKMLSKIVAQSGTRQNEVVRWWERFMGGKGADDPRLAEIAPARLARRLSVPLQLIHGKDDLVVPIDQSRMMESAAQGAGKTVDFVVLPGEDHWLSRPATRVAMLEAQIAFLEKHNPPK